MKKVILCVFYFLSLSVSPSFYSLNAQAIKKGDRLFGGSFSFSVFNLNPIGAGYYNAGNAGVIPAYGWALKNNLVFGIRGSINYQRFERVNSPTDKTTSNTFSFGPGLFLKKYKLLKDKFGIYFNNEISGHYTINKEKGSTITGSFKNYSWGLSNYFSPGVFYKFSENFFGEGNIGSLFTSYFANGNTKNVGVGATFLQNFNLGINYRIAKNK